MKQVPALEIVTHRVVWSFFFLIALTLVQNRWGEFKSVLQTPRTMLILTLTTLLVSSNWLLYIWAVNAGYMLQASLGYYINPLVNVLLGMVFLKERLRRPPGPGRAAGLRGGHLPHGFLRRAALDRSDPRLHFWFTA
jgi:chloramphenicol-sensitive protein RarD